MTIPKTHKLENSEFIMCSQFSILIHFDNFTIVFVMFSDIIVLCRYGFASLTEFSLEFSKKVLNFKMVLFNLSFNILKYFFL